MLMVGTIAGVLLATGLNNGGGAWDNAKKYIESGHLLDAAGNVLGKKTPAHAAAVVGDTVGDPFKDTAGPSLHVLVKLLATITLVLLRCSFGRRSPIRQREPDRTSFSKRSSWGSSRAD
jgi:K(+)-stimulated pyrophosphate-energized sodium pump